MADVKWIKIVTDIFDDEKILLIETLPEADSIIVIWFKLLCLAGKQNNSGVFMINNKMPYSDKMLSTIFRRKETTIQLAISTFEQFGMIEIIDGTITIPQWGKHQSMDKIEKNNEYQRNYMREYREKQRQIACNTNSKPNSEPNSNTNSKPNVRGLEENREDKIRKEKKQKYITAEIEDFFESVWKLYPVKQGKGAIGSKQKKILYDLGYDVLKKCIDRYMATNPKDGFVKHGSTFFNSGYIDYLDENYLQGVEISKQPIEQQLQESRFSCLTEEEIQLYVKKGAFDLSDEGVDYSCLTEQEKIYLTEKGVL